MNKQEIDRLAQLADDTAAAFADAVTRMTVGKLIGQLAVASGCSAETLSKLSGERLVELERLGEAGRKNAAIKLAVEISAFVLGGELQTLRDKL